MTTEGVRLQTKTVLVTPDKARGWLEHNHRNRPIKAFLLTDLTNAMLNGTFRLTHEPIAVTDDGTLLDGQHRLLAVVQSGQPVKMNVTFGADPMTFDVIDGGAKRSIADAVSIEYGRSTGTRMNVAGSRVVAIYDRVDPYSVAPWNQRTISNLKLDRATFAAIAFDMFENMTLVLDELRAHSSTYRMQANSLGALYVIKRDTAQEWELVSEFYRGLVTAADLSAGDIRLKLREGLITNPAFRRNDARLGFMVTVKAWNLFVQGDSPKILRFTRDHAGMKPL